MKRNFSFPCVITLGLRAGKRYEQTYSNIRKSKKVRNWYLTKEQKELAKKYHKLNLIPSRNVGNKDKIREDDLILPFNIQICWDKLFYKK